VTALLRPAGRQQSLHVRHGQPAGAVAVPDRDRPRLLAILSRPRRPGHDERERHGRLGGHVDDEDALAVSAVDPVHAHVKRHRDDPVQQLPVPVEVDYPTGDRPYLVDDLLVVLLPGGKPHEEDAAVLRVGERRNVLEQFLSPVRAVQDVDPALHVKPRALRKPDEPFRLAGPDQFSHAVKAARWHASSIGEYAPGLALR
jgi:hypothetical protein